jgi:CubicO group peptidase (beta-lactamase class C family)
MLSVGRRRPVPERPVPSPARPGLFPGRLLDLGEPAGPPGATIRHLLAHASGLAPLRDAVLSKPGQRIYSHRGIEIVAEVTAARAATPFPLLLAEEICLPPGLRHTRLDGSRPPR